MNFIRTKDKDTYDELLKEGFNLLEFNNGYWTFINDESKILRFNNNKKIIFTNKLNF